MKIYPNPYKNNDEDPCLSVCKSIIYALLIVAILVLGIVLLTEKKDYDSNSGSY
jgi:hypothetical protein